MSNHFLRSHEDLSDYYEALDEFYDSFDDPSDLIPSFSSDPHEIMQDLLSQIVNTRKKGLEIIKIAKKFYKAHTDSVTNSQSLVKEILSLQSEINTLIAKVSSQNKEIDTKDDRISTMSHELHEVEKEYRGLLMEVEKLRKNVKILKERKVSPKATNRKFLLKEKENNEEEIESLKTLNQDFKEELLRKAAEIDELQAKIKEMDAEIVAEKLNADKNKNFAKNCEKENLALADRVEELEYQLSAKKTEVIRLEHELIKEKSHADNIIKQYERERSASIASNFNTNSEFISIRSNFGTNNEFFTNSSNFGISSENFKSGNFEIEKEKGQNLPLYKKNAPKMETLGDWLDEENDFVEEIRPKPLINKQSTMFVLSSPVINYEKKFQFPNLNEKELIIDNIGSINIIQKKKNSATSTFELKKIGRKKVFTFDDDENPNNVTPLQPFSEVTLTLQSFQGVVGKKKLNVCIGENVMVEKNVRRGKLEVCAGQRMEFSAGKIKKLKLSIGLYESVSVRAKKKVELVRSFGEAFEILPKLHKLEKKIFYGFNLKASCKSVDQGSGISIKKHSKFRLSMYNQEEMQIFCKPSKNYQLKISHQAENYTEIKPKEKAKLVKTNQSLLSIFPLPARISLSVPGNFSIKSTCSTSLQESRISINKPNKLITFCFQHKMSTLCEPTLRKKKLKTEKLKKNAIKIMPKEKPKLFNSLENYLQVFPKTQKIEPSLVSKFMLKSICSTFAQSSGISVKKIPKFRLSSSNQPEMNTFFKPQTKSQLKISLQSESSTEIKPLEKVKLMQININPLSILPKLSKISLSVPNRFSIRSKCFTALQEDFVSVSKIEKMNNFCFQHKLNMFCSPILKNKILNIEQLRKAEIKIWPKEKAGLVSSLENCLEVKPVTQKIEVSLVPGFMLKSSCGIVNSSEISVKKHMKFRLWTYNQVEMQTFCEPILKDQLKISYQAETCTEIKPKGKVKLVKDNQSLLSIFPKPIRISLSVPSNFSIKSNCSSTLQNTFISVKKPNKLLAFCLQENTFCLPALKNTKLKVENLKMSQVNINPEQKRFLLKTFEGYLEIAPKIQKLENCLLSGFMLKSSLSVESSGISIQKHSKSELSSHNQIEMTTFCKPQNKRPLKTKLLKASSIEIKPYKIRNLIQTSQSTLSIFPKAFKISLSVPNHFSIKSTCSTSLQENRISINKPTKLITFCFQHKMSTLCEPTLRKKKLKTEKLKKNAIKILPKGKSKLNNSFENYLQVLPIIEKIEKSSNPIFMFKAKCKKSAQDSSITIKPLKKFELSSSFQTQMNQFFKPNPKPTLLTSQQSPLSIRQPTTKFSLSTFSFKRHSSQLSLLNSSSISIKSAPKANLLLDYQSPIFLKVSKKHFSIVFESVVEIEKPPVNLILSSFQSISTIKNLKVTKTSSQSLSRKKPKILLFESQKSLNVFPMLRCKNFSVSRQFSENIKKQNISLSLVRTGNYVKQSVLGLSKQVPSEIKAKNKGLLKMKTFKGISIEQKQKNKYFDLLVGPCLTVKSLKQNIEIQSWPGTEIKQKLSVFRNHVMDLPIVNRKFKVLTEEKLMSLSLINKKVKKFENAFESSLGVQTRPKICDVDLRENLRILPQKKPKLKLSSESSETITKIKPHLKFEAFNSVNKAQKLGIHHEVQMKIKKSKKKNFRLEKFSGLGVEKCFKVSQCVQTYENIEKCKGPQFVLSKNSLTISEYSKISLPGKCKFDCQVQVTEELSISLYKTKPSALVQSLKTETLSLISLLCSRKEDVPKTGLNHHTLLIHSQPGLFIKRGEKFNLDYSYQDSLEVYSSTANSTQISDFPNSFSLGNKDWNVYLQAQISVINTKRPSKHLKIVKCEKIAYEGTKKANSFSISLENILKIDNKIPAKPLFLLTHNEHIQVNPEKNKADKKLINLDLNIQKTHLIYLPPSYSVLKNMSRMSSKPDFGSQRDPIKDFFILTCQSIKLNSLQKDNIGVVPIDDLYRKVMQDNIPFNKWYVYLKQYLLSRISSRKN